MLRIANCSLPLDYTEADLLPAVCRKLRVAPADVLSVRLYRRSVDARDKSDVHFVLSLEAEIRHEAELLRRLKPGTAVRVEPTPAPKPETPNFRTPPVVVGAGPAGLFAALVLARSGAQPVLVERGEKVEARVASVEAMRTQGKLNPESNVQFGEGGAGTFSDGKLTTGIKSPWLRFVLETFVAHGADERILSEQKPHIGTDCLRRIVASIRREIEALGGKVLFSTRLTELVLRGSHVCGVHLEHKGQISEVETDTVLLCIGHSARDTAQSLFRQGVRMVPKPFAMGVRIEHPQEMINRAQYGRFASHPALGAADYKLNCRTPDGRGVYSFCMCPGGEVICAASQAGGVAVNGMSNAARDGRNANAALLVGVRPEDFGDSHPLSGFVLQRSVEQAAFRAGGGDFRAPAQRVEDFLRGRASAAPGEVQPTYLPGVAMADLAEVLPGFITENLRYGLRVLDRQLEGFAFPDALLTGCETRSSSPVRMPRLADGTAEGIDGLFPAGEGAGYAGGITSAAVDGINMALAAIERSRLL